MKIIVQDLRSGYLDVVEAVLDHGKVAHPRGYRTWEIEDAVIDIQDPRKLLPVGVGRNLKVEIAAAEALLLCGGLASPSLLSSVSSAFNRFYDGGVLHGAYGPRVRPQMESVLRRLRSDRDSRQAIVQIWDPLYDSIDTRDMPCTLNFGFRLRGEGLHMSVTMRSNDVWLGLAHDAFMFGQLGWTVANCLDVELTRLTIHQYSLHIYNRNVEATAGLHHPHVVDHYNEPRGFGYRDAALPFESCRVRAERVYNERECAPSKLTWHEQWYRDVLSPYDRATPTQNFST